MLNPPNGEQPVKYDIVKKPYGNCYHPDCGPIFGAGADLLIASNCNATTDSYSNLPHTYDGPSADYEVYTLATTHGQNHSHSQSQSPSAVSNGQVPGVPSKPKYDRY